MFKTVARNCGRDLYLIQKNIITLSMRILFLKVSRPQRGPQISPFEIEKPQQKNLISACYRQVKTGGF